LVAVVTDSAANIPAEVARDLAISVAPLEVRFGDRVFKDGVDMMGAEFYEMLTAERALPSTAAPSAGDYLSAYRATGGDQVVCVTLGSGLSVANRQARLAAEQFEGEVRVVDSESATMGEGFVAMEAARLAREGGEIDGVVARAEKVAGLVRVIGAIETFEYLRRGGRVSKLQAYTATKLDIKPVFRLDEGEIRPVARSRTRGRALARIVQDVLREVGDRPVHVGSFHAQAEEDAASLIDRVAAEAEVVERFVVECTPAIGAHTGPGLAGLAFFCEGAPAIGG
jgi:DegV family protein with EDD domain